jgi:predicted phage-related endonuclease
MELGHHMEPAVVTMFAARTGAEVCKNSEGDWIAVDKKREYLRVSPDRLFYEAGARHIKSNLRILECKTTSVAVDPDDFPVYWYCQLQYQMGVMGVKKGAVAWISSYPRLNFGYKEFDFNPDFYRALTEAIEQFWLVNVCGGIAPDDINSEDTLLKHPTSNAGETIQADAELIDVYNNLKDITREIDALEDSRTYLEDRIKMYMGDAETLVSPTGSTMAVWKSAKPSMKFNSKAFKEDDPAGYAKYMEPSPGSRRFTVK